MATQNPYLASANFQSAGAYKYPNISGVYTGGVFQKSLAYRQNYRFATPVFQKSSAYKPANYRFVTTIFQNQLSYKFPNISGVQASPIFEKSKTIASFMINKLPLNITKQKYIITPPVVNWQLETGYRYPSNVFNLYASQIFINLSATNMISYRQMTTTVTSQVVVNTSTQFQA